LGLTKEVFKINNKKIIKNIQPFILGARAFTHAARKNVTFAIYATLMGTSTKKSV
jgi:hypothetical protein